MKKNLLSLAAICFAILTVHQASAQRFLTEVFPSSSVTPDVIYGHNFEVITGSPVDKDLTMDVYEPAGAVDPMTQRPLIILLHTGSFLPTYINQTPTGSKSDSTIVEMSKQFARRGYVVASIYYRLGWNPAAMGGGANQDIRTGTLLSAVYRSIQDAKFCVRYMRNDALNAANTYKIDPNKIILGGIGSGGYTALAYATLDKPVEITLDKFLSDNTVGSPYFYTAGQPYVNQAFLGDYDGIGGIASLNNGNYLTTIANEVQFVFNMGGAMGDSTWLEAGDAPMAAFHVVGDPFAPYSYGTVIVPTTGDPVVDVSGSKDVIRIADALGNNNCFINAGFTDPLTIYANTVNNGNDGLYPFYTNPSAQAGPWEWFDSLATVAGAAAVGVPNGGDIYHNAILTNPDMSKAKALAYIDTVMGYLNPRMVYCLGLVTGLNETEALNNSINVYPNPATAAIFVKSENQNEKINSIEITDITGNSIRKIEKINDTFYKVDRESLSLGVYFVKVAFDKGTITRKIVVK